MLPFIGFIQNLGLTEYISILVVALLVFGRRLPEVGRSVGKSIVEFKKGLAGIDEEVNQQAAAKPSQQSPAGKQLDNQSPASIETPKQATGEQNPSHHQ